MTFSSRSAGVAVLLIASLGVLAAFQMWLVAAAMLLLLAALALHESGEHDRFEKLESRIGIVQASNEERADKLCKIANEMSDAINFLRGELQQISRNTENRLAGLEQRIIERDNRLDTQKFYDLVQKVIDIENRVSAISNREKEESVGF